MSWLWGVIKFGALLVGVPLAAVLWFVMLGWAATDTKKRSPMELCVVWTLPAIFSWIGVYASCRSEARFETWFNVAMMLFSLTVGVYTFISLGEMERVIEKSFPEIGDKKRKLIFCAIIAWNIPFVAMVFGTIGN